MLFLAYLFSIVLSTHTPAFGFHVSDVTKSSVHADETGGAPMETGGAPMHTRHLVGGVR